MGSLGIVIDQHATFHLTGLGHPECPERIHSAELAIAKVPHSLIPARKATLQELLLCHSNEYVDLVAREAQQAAPDGSTPLSTGDVQICPASFESAVWASGSVLSGIESVIEGNTHSAFCAVRPPGHHACSNRGMGFCLFNNAAIGARYAQKKYGLKRVLIADWDVHHGNGTQEIFYHDPSVFYFSTHQAGIYPGTGHRSETGMGNICNRPILPTERARFEVIEAFQQDLTQAMEAFQPELVLLSAGFDAHKLDPIGGLNLLEEDFATLTEILRGIAGQYASHRLISVLEGGYHLEALTSSIAAHLQKMV